MAEHGPSTGSLPGALAPVEETVISEVETTSPDLLEADRDELRERLAKLDASASHLRQLYQIEDTDPDFPPARAPMIIEFDGFINYGSPIQTTSTNALGQMQTNVITPGVINQPIFSTRKVETFTQVSKQTPIEVDQSSATAAAGTITFTLDRSDNPGSAAGTSDTLVYTNILQQAAATTAGTYKIYGDGEQIALTSSIDIVLDPEQGKKEYQQAKSDYFAAKDRLSRIERRLQVSHLNPLPPERVKDWHHPRFSPSGAVH
jgi:hypothetical protein